jgi:hypothetical protein
MQETSRYPAGGDENGGGPWRAASVKVSAHTPARIIANPCRRGYRRKAYSAQDQAAHPRRRLIPGRQSAFNLAAARLRHMAGNRLITPWIEFFQRGMGRFGRRHPMQFLRQARSSRLRSGGRQFNRVAIGP